MEEYPTPETGGGVEGIQIDAGGTGETPMPFDIPAVEPTVPGAGLPTMPLPGLPANEVPVQPNEGELSPDFLPVEPFSIEGAEDEKLPTVPADATKKPVSLSPLEMEPLPGVDTPIQLGEAPYPGAASSLVVQSSSQAIEMESPQARPEDYEAVEVAPAPAPAPLASAEPSPSLIAHQPAPIVNEVEELPAYAAPAYSAPAYAAPAPIEQASMPAPMPGDWRSRRTRSLDAAPMPMMDMPAEGAPVSYQQNLEAPMPEVTQVPAVIEREQPLGLDGYCPVELVLNERWIEGDPKWTATHQGRSYLFSSREAFDSFCRNPELYAPYYGGIDPIIALVGGGMLDGRTDLCAVYHGRLYMFSSQESLDQFRANPTQCIEAFKTHLK